MKRWLLLLLPFVLTFGFALPVSADDDIADSGSFSAMDTDSNGSISEEEYLAYHTERLRREFRAQDKDGDGLIQQAERGVTIDLPTKLLPRVQFVRKYADDDTQRPRRVSGPASVTSRRYGR